MLDPIQHFNLLTRSSSRDASVPNLSVPETHVVRHRSYEADTALKMGRGLPGA